jgi:heat shock protein HslJ
MLAGAVVAIATVGLTACSLANPTPTPTPTQSSVSFDNDWFVATGTDSAGTFDSSLPAIRVSIAKGMVSGQICNHWSGTFAVNGSAVTVGQLVSTEMYCSKPKGLMELETRFLADLPLVTSIELVDGKLHLSGDGVDFTLIGGY